MLAGDLILTASAKSYENWAQQASQCYRARE